MKVAFVYLPGRIERLKIASPADGIPDLPRELSYRPTEFFYGAFEMRDKGHTVGLFEAIERPRRSLPKYLAQKLLKGKYLPVKAYPGVIDAVWFLLERLERFDIVIANSPGVAFALGIWKYLGLLKPPIVAIQSGILSYALNPIRIYLTRRLMHKMTNQLFGIGELDPVKKAYRISSDRIEVNCFGVDTGFWTADAKGSTGDYILSVGNDAGRDYDTLIRAARYLDIPVVIVTKRPLLHPLPANVRHIQGAWNSQELDDPALRDLYRKAFAIAIPLKPNLQPSGQSVALQAMACGKLVIMTRTDGLWEREKLKHKRNVVFVPPGDAMAWIPPIEEVLDDPSLRMRIGTAARKYAVDNGQIHQFADRLERRCAETLKQMAN